MIHFCQPRIHKRLYVSFEHINVSTTCPVSCWDYVHMIWLGCRVGPGGDVWQLAKMAAKRETTCRDSISTFVSTKCCFYEESGLFPAVSVVTKPDVYEEMFGNFADKKTQVYRSEASTRCLHKVMLFLTAVAASFKVEHFLTCSSVTRIFINTEVMRRPEEQH